MPKKFIIIVHILIPLVSLFLIQIFCFGGNGIFLNSERWFMLPVNYVLSLSLYCFCLSFFKKLNNSLFLYLLIYILFGLVNFFKIKIVSQPLVFNDFSQLADFWLFLPDLVRQLEVVLVLILVVVMMFFLFFLVKKYCSIPNFWITRFFLLVFVVIWVFPVCFQAQYISVLSKSGLFLYKSNLMENCKRNGLLFCFYDDLKNIKKDIPADYSETDIRQIYADLGEPFFQKNIGDGKNKPNIIIILSESFFDVTKLPNVLFSGDPIKNIRSDFKSSLISPQFGFRTANVEFEMLTGLSNFFLGERVPYSQLIRQDIPSLFNLFKDEGYSTTVIHPYLRSMYSRDLVYKHFGLDKFISIENMTSYTKAGPYVSDDSFLREVLDQFNSTEEPQLIFALSMQNHYPFEANRFSDHKINFVSDLPINEKLKLQTYIDGIYLSDQSYLVLKEKILESSKPTIVIHFGDHLPMLIADHDVYQSLGYINGGQEGWTYEEKINMYTTPISVYNNFGNQIEFGSRMSPNFLSLEILKLAKIQPRYQFRFLSWLSTTDTILTQSFTPNFNDEQLYRYLLVQYDLLEGKQYYKYANN